MKTAMNACTWNGYARHMEEDFDVERFFAEVAEAGFEGIEVGGGKKRLGTPSQCRKRAQANGLELAAAGASVTYNPHPPNTKQYREAMRYAAELGVKYLMVCGGFIPNPRRTTYPFDYDLFADNLGRAIDFAESLGLELAYHPHRGCVVETIAETAEVTGRLPRMKICVDIAHLEASGEDAVQFIRTFRDRIVYTHIKDYHWAKDTFIELGEGDGKLDVARCVAELTSGGYDGWLTVELDKKWSGKNPRKPLASAKACRTYLKDRCGA